MLMNDSFALFSLLDILRYIGICQISLKWPYNQHNRSRAALPPMGMHRITSGSILETNEDRRKARSHKICAPYPRDVIIKDKFLQEKISNRQIQINMKLSKYVEHRPTVKTVTDFSDAVKAMTISKRLLGVSGIWPLEIRDSLFISVAIYGCVFNILALLDLIKYIKDFRYVMANVMENMLKKLQTVVNNDDEVCIMTNSSVEYKLPYKIKPLLKPHDAKSYAFGCIHEFLRTIMVISGYVGTDCLVTCTGFHLTGQLAIFNFRVKDVLNDSYSSRRGIQKIVLRHHRIIRLADILEDSFNIVIGQQLLGTTVQLCISSYQMLSSFAVVERAGIITFVMYECLLLSTLFAYCYMGECLLEESMNLCEALYLCDWYELSTNDVKSICICMIRARKPLRLTCAKFCVVSLRTFTDVSRHY
ncbi:hypothetical protein HZH68_017098 [Vespula germanica]|uniref:Odorant receptor n=1 Tax=Vespula germanica TaxID=30212 RepID=A0A834IZB0_VESGE|nr:hypothetical protein HZH68_017098 [Vespula germanica]